MESRNTPPIRANRRMVLVGLGSFLEFFLVALMAAVVFSIVVQSQLQSKARTGFEERLTLYATEMNVDYQKIKTIGETYATNYRSIWFAAMGRLDSSDLWDLSLLLHSISSAALSGPGIVDIDLYSAESGAVLSTYYGYRRVPMGVEQRLVRMLYLPFLASHRTSEILFAPSWTYGQPGESLTLLSDLPLNSQLGVVAVTFSLRAILPPDAGGFDNLVLVDRGGRALNLLQAASGRNPRGVERGAPTYVRASFYESYRRVLDGRLRLLGEIETSKLFRGYSETRNIFLLAICIALASCLAGAYFLMRGTNRYIRKYVSVINDKVRSVAEEAAVEASGDDLSMLARNIDSLIARNARFEQLASAPGSLLLDGALRGLLLGVTSTAPSLVRSRLRPHGEASCVVAVLIIDRKDAPAGDVEALSAMLDEQCSRSTALSVRVDPKIYAMLLTYAPPKSREEVIRELQLLMRRIEREIGITVTIALSSERLFDNGIADAYREALDALHYRIVAGGNRIIDAVEVSCAAPRNIPFSLEEGRVLTRMLRSSRREEVNAYVASLLRGKVMEYSPEVFKAFLLYLCSSIAKVGSELHVEAGELVSAGMVELVTSFDTLAETERHILGCCARIVEARERESHRYKKLSVGAVLDYIRANYRRPLSLSIIADELNISTSYLSSLLRRELGENYVDYLNGLRIDRAMELMRKMPRMSIKSVAAEVGYDSEHTFIRNFKKRVGRSPSDWRNSTVTKGIG